MNLQEHIEKITGYLVTDLQKIKNPEYQKYATTKLSSKYLLLVSFDTSNQNGLGESHRTTFKVCCNGQKDWAFEGLFRGVRDELKKVKA